MFGPKEDNLNSIITSRMGDGDFSDEWSKGRSSSSIQVTSPTGNSDPYLPALPKNKISEPFWSGKT